MVDEKYYDEDLIEVIPEEKEIEELQEIEEEIIEIKKEKKTPKKKSQPKEKYIILNILPDKVILKDKFGNGIEKNIGIKEGFNIGDEIEL
jgi:cellulose biosynthesis protein BcsQ